MFLSFNSRDNQQHFFFLFLLSPEKGIKNKNKNKVKNKLMIKQ